MELRGKKVLVMGLGVHGGGLGVARFCAEAGADVVVTDLRTADMLADSLAALADLPITYVLGEHRLSDFTTCDIVVQNPAVPVTSPYLVHARTAGVRIEMEMTLFFRLCAAPIIGITGTKGKTTTATLTAFLLQAWRADTVLAGNMRISALAQLARIQRDTPVVLELSSFVLEGLDAAGLSPALSAITNIHPDHLDRYSTMTAYIAAKAAIARHQDATQTVVLNAADPVLQQLALAAPSQVCWTSAEALPSVARAGDVWWRDHTLWVADSTGNHAIAHADDVQLAGMHMRANVAMAVALALKAGMPRALVAPTLRRFTGVEHRQEHVASSAGHTFINDTAATVPDAAMVALACMPKPIVWIAGGADKKLTFDALAACAAQHVQQIVLLAGTATPALHAALVAHGMADRIVGTFDVFADAVRAAQHVAPTPATILLSPGCASFGMFRNEFHRGEEFRAIVATLLAEEA
ncbi:MAG: UDP-N-acetylmuramoyl-L-alanine--D-glutamate ligase [Chloroflexaceae bacterium]|nr:UDP-N-acetylmuramoyl-L-alanine--D-glutamate ligase [Chloroflexaceae bacterium]